MNTLDAYISEARTLYSLFRANGTRTALIQSMRKVNAAMWALRMAEHDTTYNAACGRVYYYALAARQRELNALYDTVARQLTPCEWVKASHR